MRSIDESVLNALCPINEHRLWRPVLGFEDRYVVSDDGYVVSLPRTCSHVTGERRVPLRLLKRREVFEDKRLTGVVVKLSNQEHGFNADVTIGRLMLEAFYGAMPGHVAHFKDGSPKNLTLGNLEWSTWVDIAHQSGYGMLQPSQKELANQRKANLKALIESRFGGSFSAFAKATGKAQCQVSNLFRDKATNGIGTKLARQFETLLELPVGMLDNKRLRNVAEHPSKLDNEL